MKTQKKPDQMESDLESRWEDEYKDYCDSQDDEDDEDDDETS